MKKAKHLKYFANNLVNELNLKQSSINGLYTFAFRLISLIMIPFTLVVTSSDDYASMATAAIIFQLISTLFIGSIQKGVFESNFWFSFRYLRRTLQVNFFIFLLLILLSNLAFSEVRWLNESVVNLGFLEAFLYSVFNGWFISVRLKSGEFRSIRKIQTVEFLLIGPFRLLILYLSHSLLIWASLGVFIRSGQLAFACLQIRKNPKTEHDLTLEDGHLSNQRVDFNYAVINLAFWMLLNSAVLMSLNFATSRFIETLQVSIAIAGILGTILTQITNALIPLYLKNQNISIRRKILRQFSFLSLSFVLAGAPIAVIAVSQILSISIANCLSITLIYISINFLFGFISLYQVFSYGSASRTTHLRNGCIASILISFILDAWLFTREDFRYFSYSSLVGFLFLTIYLYFFKNSKMKSDPFASII